MQARGVMFNWSFDVACNYRCAYCYYDGQWKEMAATNNRQPLEVVVEAWRKVYERYGECYILFSGGEPTVYPRFDELLIALSRWHRWGFNTNLSWPLSRWDAMLKQIHPSRGDIFMSFHPSQEPDFQKFMDKAAFVRDLGFWSTVSIVVYPPHLPELRSYCEALGSRGLKARPQPFVGVYEGRSYPDAYSPIERALIHELSAAGSSTLLPDLDYALGDSSPRGKPCHAGQLYCAIERSGDVYRCLQLRENGVAEKLGNFYTGFELKTAPAICPADFCKCGETRWLKENLALEKSA